MGQLDVPSSPRDGLADGIAPHEAGANFRAEHRRVVWVVQNTLHSSPDDGEGGDSWELDAINGSVLERLAWASIP